jgi:nucleoside-diphosphate-sugar epimerase
MGNRSVIVTGSSGFLGAAICVDLSRDHHVYGIDRREPSRALQTAAPGVRWFTIDISDRDSVDQFFNAIGTRRQPVDFVLHMAAFYHFGQFWLPEDERTNVLGLRNILDGAQRSGTGRFIFAGSIASLPSPAPGGVLTEASRPIATIAYTRSKTLGENLLNQYSEQMATATLRIGGVFSDWCELPPLYSLTKLWSKPGLMGRCIPGRGNSGFPYIHRRNLVACVRRIIERHESLGRAETLFAAPDGCTTHNAIFPVIREILGPRYSSKPVYVPPWAAQWGLFVKNRIKVLINKKRYERRWMMAYVDQPLVVDTAYTRKTLEWAPAPEWGIIERLPVLMDRFRSHRTRWERRNIRRNEGRYQYGERS